MKSVGEYEGREASNLKFLLEVNGKCSKIAFPGLSLEIYALDALQMA
jgi:hypothetical protein